MKWMQITYFPIQILSLQKKMLPCSWNLTQRHWPQIKTQFLTSVLPGFEIFSLPFSQGLCHPVQFQAVWQPFTSSVRKEQFPIFSICLAAALPSPCPMVPCVTRQGQRVSGHALYLPFKYVLYLQMPSHKGLGFAFCREMQDNTHNLKALCTMLVIIQQ